MVPTNSHNGFPRLRIRWHSLGWHGLTGFLFGYVVLHPVAMVIFQWLDPRMTAAMPHHHAMSDHAAGGVLGPIVHSFQLDMLPMALVFGLMGALIATFYGHHRLAICFQRDRLAEELGRNEKLRAELAEHAERLAQQAERLAQQNEELARLESANRRTSQFMAHDFKTALSCVAGFANELLEKPALRDDLEVAGALAAIRRQAHRMLGSVLDLLQLARVRERGDPPMERTSVSALLHEAVSDFSLPAHEEQMAVGEEHLRCPPVLANRQLLRRVLCNLISNALKHNGPDTRVWLDAHLSESQQEVVFSCRDDGAGVPPEVFPSLFRQFTPANGSASGSTGLGLAFCKAAVEAHWGRIWCENLAQGSQFCFAIPLDKEHANGQCIYDI